MILHSRKYVDLWCLPVNLNPYTSQSLIPLRFQYRRLLKLYNFFHTLNFYVDDLIIPFSLFTSDAYINLDLNVNIFQHDVRPVYIRCNNLRTSKSHSLRIPNFQFFYQNHSTVSPFIIDVISIIVVIYRLEATTGYILVHPPTDRAVH